MQLWVAVVSLLAAVTVVGQEPVARFSAAVQVVEVYATVTDAAGEPVMNLRQDDFDVFENDARQEITAFAAGEFPLTVAVGIDRSVSMAGERLRLAKQATRNFLSALGPDDRSMVLAIGSDAEVVAPLGTNREEQIRSVDRLDAWSTTALHDAVIVAVDRLEPEPGRRALVVFSDGVDRYSRASSATVLDRVRRGATIIYPVVIGPERPPVTAELAVASGGRSFQLRDARELESTLQRIARELRHQYLLGYVPTATPGDGRWRSIRVALKAPRADVRVRARDGYFAE